MAVTTCIFHGYAKGVVALGSKLANLGSDTLKMALLSSYTVGSTQQTAEFVSDVISGGVGVEVANGNGYMTGGVTLASVGWSATAANSWTVTATTTTGYNLGDIVKPSGGNGFLYQAVIAGTSGGSAPTWPTVVGTTVTDGTVTWLNIGTAVTVLTAASPVWTSSGAGFTTSHTLVYDSTPGSAATNPVIAYGALSVPLSPTAGGTLTITIPAAGILAVGSS